LCNGNRVIRHNGWRLEPYGSFIQIRFSKIRMFFHF
jgi:hypothetical protein